MSRPRTLLLATLLLPILNTIAQTTGKYEAAFKLGAVVYEGDLTPNATGDLKTTSAGFSMHISRIVNQHLSIRLNYVHGKLRGDDSRYSVPAWRQQRNLNFTSRINEISIIGELNALSLLPNEAGIVNFTPYLLGGVGLSLMKIHRDWSRFNATHFSSEVNVTSGLAADINRQPPNAVLVIPVGLGVRYGFSPRLSLIFESMYRQTFNDYIDGFSKAANPGRDDHYHSHMLGLIYSFGKKSRLDCPPVRQ